MPTPSNKRFLVVAALFLLSLILYIDRAAISSAKTAMAAELALYDTEMGWVFGAFSLTALREWVLRQPARDCQTQRYYSRHLSVRLLL